MHTHVLPRRWTALLAAAAFSLLGGSLLRGNDLPSVGVTLLGASTVPVNGTTTFRASATDPEGDWMEIHIDVTLPNGANQPFAYFGSDDPSGNRTWTLGADQGLTLSTPGVYVIRVTARDTGVHSEWCAAATAAVTVTVPNRLPSTSVTLLGATSVPIGGSTPFRVGASDPDGDWMEVHIDVRLPNGSVQPFAYFGSNDPSLNRTWNLGADQGLSLSTAGTYTILVTARDTGQHAEWCSAATASVSVYGQPTILQQPASQTVTQNNPVTFSIQASGGGTLTYQWQFNGAPIGGAQGTSYTIPSAQPYHAGAYACVVSNAAGSVTTSAAYLNVTPSQVAPSIAVQPTSANVVAGSPASFSVTANGSAPLSFQWYKNNGPVSGANTATLSFPSAQSGDAGDYYVRVSNAVGAVNSTTASLTVRPALEVRLDSVTYYRYDDTGALLALPSNATKQVGDWVKFASTATSASSNLVGHDILVWRPSLAQETATLDASSTDFYGATIASYSLAADAKWCHLDWDFQPGVDYFNASAFYSNPGRQSSIRNGDFLFLLDAPSSTSNPWKVVATATNATTNTYSVVQALADVNPIPLPTSVPSTARFNRANANEKLVAAFYNAGQPLGGFPSQGVWNRRWLMLGNQSSGTPPPIWGANQLYPIISNGSGSSVLSRDVNSQTYAARTAVRLAAAGVDFAILDYTNTSTSPKDQETDVLRSARNVVAGFQSANTGSRKVRITMLLGLGSQWWDKEYATALANFLSIVNEIRTQFATSSTSWQYVDGKPLLLLYTAQEGPQMNHAGANALSLAAVTPVTITATHGGSGATAAVTGYANGGIAYISVTAGGSGYSSLPGEEPTVTFGGQGHGALANAHVDANGRVDRILIARNSNNEPIGGTGYAASLARTGGSTSDSNDPNHWGTLKSEYLADLTLADGQRIDQVFTIRYVGSLLTASVYDNRTNYCATVNGATYIKTGHWWYIDWDDTLLGSVMPSDVPANPATMPTQFEAVTVRPRYAEVGRDPARFRQDITDATALNPRFLVFLAWNEYGDPNDEQSPLQSWTLADNNKLGDTYVRIMTKALETYK